MAAEEYPPQDLPPLPRPFAEPPPRRTDPERRRRGCAIGAAAGCGALLLILIVGFAVAMTQADELLGFVLDFSRQLVVEGLPDDVTEAERARLDRAFEGVLERYRTRPATNADNRRLQLALTDALRRIDRGLFDRDDLRQLIERLERVAAPTVEE